MTERAGSATAAATASWRRRRGCAPTIVCAWARACARRASAARAPAQTAWTRAAATAASCPARARPAATARVHSWARHRMRTRDIARHRNMHALARGERIVARTRSACRLLTAVRGAGSRQSASLAWARTAWTTTLTRLYAGTVQRIALPLALARTRTRRTITEAAGHSLTVLMSSAGRTMRRRLCPTHARSSRAIRSRRAPWLQPRNSGGMPTRRMGRHMRRSRTRRAMSRRRSRRGTSRSALPLTGAGCLGLER